MPLNSLPDADFNLPEMKTKSPSCPSGRVHMYVASWLLLIFLLYNFAMACLDELFVFSSTLKENLHFTIIWNLQ